MPILKIDLVGPVSESLNKGLSLRLANAAASVLETPPQRSWVRLSRVAIEDYAENGGGPREGDLPVIVSLMLAEPPSGPALEDLLIKLSAAIAVACGRDPGRVHIILEPPAKGRAMFGGKLL